MRLKTKLVLAVTALTFAIVLVLGSLFVGELLRQRIEQTTSANDVLAREVLLMTRQALEQGIKANPPSDRSEAAFQAAVLDALRSDNELTDVMNAVVRYSPTVQDVSVTDAHGTILVSTDPDTLNQPSTSRLSLKTLQTSGLFVQARQLFGSPRVLDISQSLDRNGSPFLAVHVGVRSTFLQSLRAVAGLDISDYAKFELISQVDDYVFGFSLREAQEFEEHERGWPPEMMAFFQRILDGGEYPLIRQFLGDDVGTGITRIIEHMNRPGRFERGLGRLLDGIERGLDEPEQ